MCSRARLRARRRNGAPDTNECNTTVITSGAVAEGAAAAAVNVQANASGLTFGNHVATLCVGTNDPAQQMIQVPVNLTNTDPSDVIFIDGFDGAH